MQGASLPGCLATVTQYPNGMTNYRSKRTSNPR